MVLAIWLRLSAVATATCCCTGAVAWTLWSKRSSDEPQPQGGIEERRQRIPWLANYDDQSVDSVPSWTKDFEYTRAQKAAPFFPDSEVHVVDVAPLQETFTGIHTYENELFRAENPGPTDNSGVRVVSGLALDAAENPHQAHGPPPNHRPVPGVAPLCEVYNNPAMSLTDWENATLWANIMELGIIRLTPAVLEPLSKPMTLLLKGHECNVARTTAYIRLGSESAGGIVLRAKTQADYVAAVLDTERRVVSLDRYVSGVKSTVSEAAVFYVNPSIRHQIVVNDNGESGMVEVSVDNRLMISAHMPATDKGRFGVLVSKGSALFDNFAIER